MEHFKMARKLWNKAIDNERNANYVEAIKCHKEFVLMIKYLVNNEVTSKTVREKLMCKAIESIKRSQALENIVLHLENAKKNMAKIQLASSRYSSTEEMLEAYFETPKGKSQCKEKIEAITNIARIINISKPELTLEDIYGMEGM